MIITEARLVKPARWSARGPRMQDNYLLRKCLALFPLWDGRGPDAIELMRWAGAAYHAQWEVAPGWGVGRAGPCTVHNGTDTVGLNVTGSFTTLSKLKPTTLPLSIEAVIEPFSATPATAGLIFCNDGSRTNHAGFVLMQAASGALWFQYGDNTGATSNDRRSFNSTTAPLLNANQIYHVAATIRGSTDASLWVDGAPVALTTSGAGGSIGYSTSPARIGSRGGMGANNTGFNGRIYLVAFYNRVFTDREVHLRARDPYALIRRPLTTARYASFVPPPGGDSGKGSVVCMIG